MVTVMEVVAVPPTDTVDGLNALASVKTASSTMCLASDNSVNAS